MSEYAINVSGVNKHYAHFDLSDINLQLPKGEILGFIGPNGAGKSTTIRILMGLIKQDSGAVEVLGHKMPEQQIAAKWDIGFASEDLRLYETASLQWHMDFMSNVYDKWDSQYAKTLLKKFDLTAEQELKGFSHGQRVKASLLLILARRPKLLILDEPTTGLDPVARYEVLGEFMDVLADDERTILFSSHNTQDVEQLSDRITFIDNGRIVKSHDKETFIDRWRRIRIECDRNTQLPQLPGILDVRRAGGMANLTTDTFDEKVIQTLTGSGINVLAVEHLNLEEIFISEVMASRKEAAL